MVGGRGAGWQLARDSSPCQLAGLRGLEMVTRGHSSCGLMGILQCRILLEIQEWHCCTRQRRFAILVSPIEVCWYSILSCFGIHYNVHCVQNVLFKYNQNFTHMYVVATWELVTEAIVGRSMFLCKTLKNCGQSQHFSWKATSRPKMQVSKLLVSPDLLREYLCPEGRCLNECMCTWPRAYVLHKWNVARDQKNWLNYTAQRDTKTPSINLSLKYTAV